MLHLLSQIDPGDRASLGAALNAELAALTAELTGYAERHRAVIARFGRFPHRNAVLGRESTPEEQEFLRKAILGQVKTPRDLRALRPDLDPEFCAVIMRTLARAPEDIRLGTVVVDTEPSLRLVECFDAKTNTCPITRHCGLKGILHDALQALPDGEYEVCIDSTLAPGSLSICSRR